MPTARPILGALLGLALWWPAVAGAQTAVALGGFAADPAAPVEIEADALEVDQGAQSATFRGHVVVVQGDMRLAADEMRVDYAPGEDGQQGRIRTLSATGNVTMATATDAAEAEAALYDVEAGTVTLSGSVLLTQGQSVIAGETLVADLRAGTATMSGRVRTTFVPGSGGQ